jgi:phage-related protein
MSEKFIREIYYYKDYYLDFFETLKPVVKRKFNWTLKLIATIDRVPVKYFKHMEGTTGLFEVRVEVGSDIYRVLSFFDEGRLIILLNGFQKKSSKTPKNEIELAEKLKKQYFDEMSLSSRLFTPKND